jgi:hypothetical protein
LEHHAVIQRRPLLRSRVAKIHQHRPHTKFPESLRLLQR